ncbi:hypothetical protein D3C75_506800 [compost metagenome]
MEMDNLLLLTTREELRSWLQANGSKEKCCWITVSMTPAPDKLLYLDVVEEALCFGWIDGVKKSTEHGVVQRLSPRSKRSSWTELNKERVRRLDKLGLLSDEGRRVLPDMGPESFVIDEVIEQALKEDPEVYANFLAFPPLYSRIRIDNIQGYKKQPELFQSRLDKFIANTRDNRMYGAWHDNGHLLEH